MFVFLFVRVDVCVYVPSAFGCVNLCISFVRLLCVHVFVFVCVCVRAFEYFCVCDFIHFVMWRLNICWRVCVCV